MDLSRGVFVAGPNGRANRVRLRAFMLESLHADDRVVGIGVDGDELLRFTRSIPHNFMSPMVVDALAPHDPDVDLWYRSDPYWDSFTRGLRKAQRASAEVVSLDPPNPGAFWDLSWATLTGTKVYATATVQDRAQLESLFQHPESGESNLSDLTLVWVEENGAAG